MAPLPSRKRGKQDGMLHHAGCLSVRAITGTQLTSRLSPRMAMARRVRKVPGPTVRVWCSNESVAPLTARGRYPYTTKVAHWNSAGKQSFNRERQSVHPIETLLVNDTPVGHMASEDDPNPRLAEPCAYGEPHGLRASQHAPWRAPGCAPQKALRHSGAGGNYSRESPPMGSRLRCRGVGLCLRLGGPGRPAGRHTGRSRDVMDNSCSVPLALS